MNPGRRDAMKWACRFGWHDWNKWHLEQRLVRRVHLGVPLCDWEGRTVMERECKECGLPQWRVWGDS